MAQSKYTYKSHNVTVLLYHIVLPAKYRRVVFSDTVDATLKDICLELSKRYEIYFLEIGTDRDHFHFLVQSVTTYSVSKIITIIKSFTACDIFRLHTEVKHQLWVGEFWTDGCYTNTVSQHGNKQTISIYVKNQGVEKEYKNYINRFNCLSF